MSAVEYLPGDRWLISGPTAAVHLAGETATALRWWPRIRDGVTARELVTFLQQDGVLFSSEPFAMVVIEAEPDGEDACAVRVFVGGDTVVLVENTAGHQISVTGQDLLTWSERVIPDAAVVYVNCTTLPAAGELLPMPAGVVRADLVRWAVGSGRRTPQESAQVPPVQMPPVEMPPVEMPPVETPPVEMPPAARGGSDDVVGHDVVGHDVVGADVVGDDAITLIGVVPVAGPGPDAADDAEAAVPQFVVPEQDPGHPAASDPEDLELEQTAVTPDPVIQDEPEQGEAEEEPDGSGALDAPHPLEETISHDEDAHGDAAEQDAPVAELLGEVTQTVPPEDLAEHGDPDGDPDGGADDSDSDDSDSDDGNSNDGNSNDGNSGDGNSGDGNSGDGNSGDGNSGGGNSGELDPGAGDPDDVDPDAAQSVNALDPLPVNPFPRMSLPPFVPPSAPGFITSATPGVPTRAPFAPPPYPVAAPAQPQNGPVGADTIRDVPRPSGPPPFVPASTTLPPISVVPSQGPAGSAAPAPHNPADPDAVATGIPPVPPAADSENGGANGGIALPAEGGPGASRDQGADSRVGDHDGHTVLAESLPEDHRPPAMPAEPGPGQVYASLCPAGHPNAPYAGDCRVCGAPIPATDPVLVQKPTMAVLRMSSGAVIELDRRVVVGRAPSVSRVASADVPHLVTVASPHGDVSRSHVEVQVDDWHIVVTDLNSTNGTEIHAPGRPVQLLRAGAGIVVEIGWQIDLGDGAGFLVDHL